MTSDVSKKLEQELSYIAPNSEEDKGPRGLSGELRGE